MAARDLKPTVPSKPKAAGALPSAYRLQGDPGIAPLKEIAALRVDMEDRLSELKTMLLDLAHRQSLA